MEQNSHLPPLKWKLIEKIYKECGLELNMVKGYQDSSLLLHNEIIVLTPTLSQLISSFWFLLCEQPGFGTATKHICRQPFPLSEALQNCPNVGNSASDGKSMAHHWHFWHCTALHGPFAILFCNPISLLTKSRLAFSLSYSSAQTCFLWASQHLDPR